ncbi:hypothetical protein X975_10193, partial [Stegodyphus mimosarum]
MEPGVAELLEASVKLNCSMETRARALILFHHFITCAGETKYDTN